MQESDQENNLASGDVELPRFRRELQASAQIYDGQPYWVVKDPVALRYFRFNREEYFIIEQLRRGVSLDQLKEAHRREFRGADLTNQEVGQFISSLTTTNLLIVQQAGRDEMLYQASKRRWKVKLISQISNFMFFKIPLYDPDKLFNRMIDHLRFIWTKTFCLFYLAMMALAVVLVMRRWADFSSMFHTTFFTLRNLPMLFIVIWFIKALHELGHGLTCKNYGGECHEMGWLFLVFTPFFYCNVTDSWTFASKARRLLVTAGGIMTELFFAALATIVWYFTEQPGFIHALMFNVIMACSFSTVLFNANPLLKYDGYYFLMDVIEVPNLRQRSSDFMRNLFIRYILGGHPNETPEEHRFKNIFPIYSIAAYVYRWFIMIVILYAVYMIFDKLKLTVFGTLLVSVSALTMLIFPLVRSGVMITRRRAALGISNVRLLLLLALLVTGGALALFWPLEQHVTLNFVLEPARMHWLRSEVPGYLNWAPHVTEGARLESDSDQAVVAYLDNPQLDYQRIKLDTEIEQVEIQIAQYKLRNLTGSHLEQLQERRDTLNRERQRLDKMIAAQNVTIPFSGEVLISDRDMQYLRGKFLSTGEPLMLLADTRELVAKVWVPENTWARIFRKSDQRGQIAELMLYGFSKNKFTGQVTTVSSHTEDSMGEFGEKMALSNKVGGEVVTEYDPETGMEKPIAAVYEVSIELDADKLPRSARAFMSGRTRIACGRYTLYQWGRDSLLRFISPEVRL
jgi:putative peptide zinc metalloprotease protein